MKLKTAFTVIAMGVITLAGVGEEVRTIGSFGEIRKMSAAEAAKGCPVELSGVVTYAMPDKGFVLSPFGPFGLRDQNAVFVKSDRRMDVGRTLTVRGRTFVWENIAAMEAHDIAVAGLITLPPPDIPKWSDVRKGWRNLRRARCCGFVDAVDFHTDEKGRVWTYLTTFGASVRIRGRVKGAERMVGELVEGSGITRNSFDADGRVLAAWFEIASPNNVRIYATRNEWAMYALFTILVVLAVAALGFGIAYLRARRRRKDMELVAADRRRIAAQLHDTIDQHLAGANFLLTAALASSALPETERGHVENAAQVLADAKAATRDMIVSLQTESIGDAL